jgi:hypothetical protein
VIWAHFARQYQLLVLLLRYLAKTILVATIFRIISPFAQLFAIFIPIKIVLMIGTDTIPALLQGHMTPETRDTWILGLTLVTLALYLSSVVLELASNRMLSRGGQRLAGLMELTEPTEKRSSLYYKKTVVAAGHSYAYLTVFILGAVGLLIISPFLFLSLAAIIVFQLLVVNSIFRKHSGLLGRVGTAIRRNPAKFLRYLGIVNFICVFLLLLLSYFLSGTINPTSAILALLLARKMFQSLSKYARQAVQLERIHKGIYSSKSFMPSGLSS